MPRTKAYLESILNSAANSNNLNQVTSIVNSLTAQEKTLISSNVYDNTLIRVSNYTFNSPGTSTDSLTTSTLRNFMEKVGWYTSGAAIGNAMTTLAGDRNFAALDAVTDYLTPAQKSSIPYNNIDTTLLRIVDYTDALPGTQSDAVTANTIRDFMAKLGANASGAAIGNAMTALAGDRNFGGLDAVTDYITASKKGSIGYNNIDTTLLRITDYTYALPGTQSDAVTANTIRDFMAKLGANASGAAIGNAMTTLAGDRNFAALDAVTDYLTPAQKSSISYADIDTTLLRIVDYTDALPGTQSDATTAYAARDFMAKLGANASGAAIGSAMTALAGDRNFGGLDAVTDYITASKKGSIGYNNIDTTLLRITDYTYALPGTQSDAVTANTIRDFMAKLGAYASGAAIGHAMTTLAGDHNFAALDAVTDYLTPAQKSSISYADIDTTLLRIVDYTDALPGTQSDSDTANVLRDFMGKLGANASQAAVSSASATLLYDHNMDGLAAVLDNATDAGALAARNGNLSLFNSNNVKLYFSANDVYYGNNSNETIITRGGNDIARGGNGNDNLYGGHGNDTLYGDAGNDVLHGGGGVDYLSGGIGADRFVVDPTRTGVDTVRDFNASQGDKLDFSAVLTNFSPVDHAITDFITKTTVNGNDTMLYVDADGKGAGAAFAALTLEDVSVDILALYNQGKIIV
jgi:Ca2+-binding RTX toxin-like protein